MKLNQRVLAPHKEVWIGEGRYENIPRWYLLWSTCRHSKEAATDAVEGHPTFGDFTETRIVRFVRPR